MVNIKVTIILDMISCNFSP